MDSAADSGAAQAGAGLSKRYASRSVAFPFAVNRARSDAGPVVEQDGAVGKVEACGRFRPGVLVELPSGPVALCKFFDVTGSAELALPNGLLCVFCSGAPSLRSLQA